jgi:hypothetical protein
VIVMSGTTSTGRAEVTTASGGWYTVAKTANTVAMTAPIRTSASRFVAVGIGTISGGATTGASAP